MRIKEYRYFACDFETTVYENQDRTEVWSAAIVEIGVENEPLVFGSINAFFKYVSMLDGNIACYFHNLKFDGAFIVDFLFRKGFEWQRVPERDMHNNTFKAAISEMGQWYNIIVKVAGKVIEIRDSLKLLPFSLKRIGESFKTKHKKLEMEYEGYRCENCYISPEELEYIKNDVYVLKEALEIMFSEGHTDLTIGSCCLKEFKKTYDKEDYENFFQTCMKWKYLLHMGIIMQEIIYAKVIAGVGVT